MSRNKSSIGLSDDETAIADMLARKNNVSRSRLFRDLLVRQALESPTMKTVERLRGLSLAEQDGIIKELRQQMEKTA